MSIHDKEAPGTESTSRGNALGRKHSKVGTSRSETESAQFQDAKEAAADRTPEGPDVRRVSRGPPAQGRGNPTLDAEQEPLEAYEDTLGGPLGVKGGKGRSRKGQERPKEEDYGSRPPALDQQEDAPEVDWQAAPDHTGQEAAWTPANMGPKATCPPPYPQDSRTPREVQRPGRETGRQEARPGDTSTPSDGREAPIDRLPEMPDLHRVTRRPPTHGRKDHTLDAEREPQEAHGGRPRGPPGLKRGKGRGRGGRERPEEEDYCSRRPAPDRSEEALKVEG